jgi:hypothetical protein
MATQALHPDQNRNFHHLRGRYRKRVKDKAQDKAAEIVATALVGGGGAAFHEQIWSALGSWLRMLF